MASTSGGGAAVSADKPAWPANTAIATVIAALTAVAAAEPNVVPPAGNCSTLASGPIINRRRPIEMLMNARTTSGSNCVPAFAASSLRAVAAGIGFL